jgi:hypothetical protein
MGKSIKYKAIIKVELVKQLRQLIEAGLNKLGKK